jgi:hypothetical protein
MRPNRPKQHVHNWQLRLTENSPTKILDNPYTDFGFKSRRYWACIRGNRIKHTRRWNHFDNHKMMFMGYGPENVTILASGISNEKFI